MAWEAFFPFFVTAFVSLFAIIDAVGIVPIFLTLTPEKSEAQRRETVSKATWVVLVTLVTFALLGDALFAYFGVTLEAFRIAGGLILLKTAFDMLEAKPRRSRQTPEEAQEGPEREDVAVIPLAIPLLSGPGAISAVIVLSGQAQHPGEQAALFAAILLNVLLVWVILRSAGRVAGWLRETGLRVFTRIMGLILAAVSVQFILKGIQGFWTAAV